MNGLLRKFLAFQFLVNGVVIALSHYNYANDFAKDGITHSEFASINPAIARVAGKMLGILGIGPGPARTLGWRGGVGG